MVRKGTKEGREGAGLTGRWIRERGSRTDRGGAGRGRGGAGLGCVCKGAELPRASMLGEAWRVSGSEGWPGVAF